MMDQIFNGTDFKLANDYDQENYCQVRENKALKGIDYFAM